MTQIQLVEAAKTSNPLEPIDAVLQRILNPNREQTALQRARQIMGASLADTTDEDLEIYLTEFQHLIDYWVDTYEREIFSGLTLRQLLGQG